MNITPTTIRRANTMATKIAVYDTEQKRAVLLFKSITLCATYLFGHRIFKITDRSKFHNLILKRCCQKKQKEELNVFEKPFTYRYVNDEQKEQLADNDYVVLDNNYINEEYELKKDMQIKVYDNKSYDIEKILGKGDTVEITAGKLNGYTTRILEIKTKRRETPGTMLYALKIPGGIYDFKANVLKLIEKYEMPKDAGISVIELKKPRKSLIK